MPIHDWRTVNAGTFHAFHHYLAGSIATTLNSGILPDVLGFFRVHSRYDNAPTDMPSTIVTAFLVDTSKVVLRYGRPPDTPQSLLALEHVLDSTGAAAFGHHLGRP